MDCQVSICSTTYNLEKYIRQAIDSWLMQVVNFSVEIIICDDCSHDATCDIIEEYAKEHDNIRLVRSEHVGMMPNFLHSILECKGKYIALCDGDDYWTDPFKLQKQYDFMEANPDFSACFTNSLVVDDKTGGTKIAKIQIWDVADGIGLLKHRDDDNIQMSPGHTSSYFFRNGLISKFPDWMYGNVMTDFPLYMLVSQFGKAKFINEVCTVYRAGRAESDSNSNWSFEKSWKQRINAYECVNEELSYKYSSIINPILFDYYFKLGKLLWKQSRRSESMKYLVKSLKIEPTMLWKWTWSKALRRI